PIMNDVGGPVMPELVGNSHKSLPLDASNAWNMRSFVPPVKTRPPPVASIGPQFWDFAYVWVHTRVPVSTFHACTSPIWSASGATSGRPVLGSRLLNTFCITYGLPSMKLILLSVRSRNHR